jgi:dTDP-4-amino-4,6-dideoxygalactose transaminase
MSKPAIEGGQPVRNEYLQPFYPMIDDAEIDEVVNTLKSGWLTTGPKVKKFETLFSEYIGCKHSVALSSCTAALKLSTIACGIEQRTEVITTPLTFAATANILVQQNITPVFVDVETSTGNIDASLIEDKITEKTRAILPVHYAGHPCEMDEIMSIARENNLWVIEDAAHAVGAEYRGEKIGCIGDLTAFSFYATKNLTTGEGGMLTTNKDELEKRSRIESLHGMSKDAWKRYTREGSWYYEIVTPGFKFNMTDMQASIGIHQLRKMSKMQKRREQLAARYNDAFDNVPEIDTTKVKEHVKHAWHLFPIFINSNLLKIDRAQFIDALRAENIGTSVHFIPLHLHPYYKDTFGFKRGDFPVAEDLYDREISIPLYPAMTDDDLSDVLKAIEKIVSFYRK